MEEQKVYIYPKNAKRKLKSAKDHGQNIYIYGMTGYGKSELINHYLARQKNLIVIDAENAVVGDFELPEGKNQKTTVVIDQLQYADDEMVQEEIRGLLYRKDLWVILVSRATCPDYLMAYRLKGVGFVEISEEDLSLSLTEMEEYLVKSGIIMNEENLQKLYQLSRGHGMLLSITVDFMRQDTMTNGTSTKVDETLVSRSQKILWDYVEHKNCNLRNPIPLSYVQRSFSGEHYPIKIFIV